METRLWPIFFAIFSICITVVENRNLIESGFDFVADADSLYDNITTYKDEPEYARIARYIVHKAHWGSVGTISTLKSIHGFPMVNTISVADSEKGAESTGHIYFLLPELDNTAIDLATDNRLTILFSNNQDLACEMRNIDPMEPTCARVMLSGKAKRLENGTTEYITGMNAFISNHPAAEIWVKVPGHNFFLSELDISQVAVLATYGGPHYIDVTEYYKAILSDGDDGFLRKSMD